MEGFYLEIRAENIAPNATTWVMAWPVRTLSYTIDTVLLTAAQMLTSIIQQYRFVDSWLTMKVLLLVVYIVLGYRALRGRRLS